VAQRDAVIADYARSQAEVIERQAALEAVQASVIQKEMDRDTALDIAEKAEQARDEAKAELEREARASTNREDQLRSDLAHARVGLEAEKALREIVTAERDTLTTEAETLRTDLARARADIATELERQQAQRGVMLAAMRSLFVDASERLLQREVERARKHQQTPDKLRSWMETFYANHTEVCRNLFRPLVGPWTAIAGGVPSVLLERLVTEHIETSTRALSAVLDADDPDQMAGMLERTLRRWEDERAEVMADTLVREGMERNG
jgi:hypothetical protein